MKARLQSMMLGVVGTLATFSAVTYTSCNNDKCKAIVCAYGGVCNEGSCVCPSGYEGPQCETVTRDKYKGIWMVLEKGSTSNTAQYTVSVENGSNVSDVKTKNFRNSFQEPVSGYVKGDTLYIPQQTVNNYVVQGIGYLEDDKYYSDHGKLTVRYSVRSATNPSGVPDDYGLEEGDPSIWNK